MKPVKYILSSIIVASIPLGISAQQLSSADRRYMLMDVLDAVEQYEVNSAISSDNQGNLFRKMFESGNILIYNDLLGISGDTYLSVDDYVNFMLTEIQEPTVKLRNINYEEPEYMDYQWVVPVSFDKEMEYMNNCDVLFSSKDYYNADYHIEIEYVWDKQPRTCTIKSLSGEIASDEKPLDNGYMIFQKSNAFDDNLLFNNEHLEYNYFGQVFIVGGDTTDIIDCFTYPMDDDIDYSLSYDDEKCRLVHMNYRSKRFKLRPYVSFSLGNAISSDYSYSFDTSSKLLSYGIDIGYSASRKKVSKFTLYSGFGISTGNLDLALDNLSYSYMASSEYEIDQELYDRYYEISDAYVSISYKDINVPLYADIDWKVSPRVSIFMDLGVKAYINIKNEVASFSADYSTYGVYSQYDNLVIDGNSFDELPNDNPNHFTINGFVNDGTLSIDNMDDVKMNTLGKFSMDAIGGLGCRVSISSDWSIEMGVSYQRTLLSTSNQPFQFSSTSNPISYLGREVVESPSVYMKDTFRNAVSLRFGAVFRF